MNDQVAWDKSWEKIYKDFWDSGQSFWLDREMGRIEFIKFLMEEIQGGAFEYGGCGSTTATLLFQIQHFPGIKDFEVAGGCLDLCEELWLYAGLSEPHSVSESNSLGKWINNTVMMIMKDLDARNTKDKHA